MKIVKNSVVELSYKIFDARTGELLDQSGRNDHLTYLHGGYDGIFPLVEEALQDKDLGHKLSIGLKTEDAFGEVESDLIRREPLDIFPKEFVLELGMSLETDDPTTGGILIFRVVDIDEKNGVVTLDANPELAGRDIVFECEVMSVRQASEEEIDSQPSDQERDL